MLRLLFACIIIGSSFASAGAAEVETDNGPPQQQFRRGMSRGGDSRGVDGGAYEAPREFRRSAPGRFGFTCQTERRECDLNRGQPLGTYCECVSPSGRLRDGRVTR